MVRAPLHFHGRLPVPEVAPLTYRDGVTQLELVYELSQYLKKILHPSLQSTVDQVVADAEKLLSEANAQYVDGVQEFQRIHDAFMSDVNASLIALNDSAVTGLVEDNTSMLGSTLRSVFATNKRVDDVSITPQMFGAISDFDGVVGTDNHAAFQRAIDSVHGGGTVVIPGGDYYLSDTLHITKNITLISGGAGDRVSGGQGAKLVFPAGITGIHIDGAVPPRPSKWHVGGFTLESQSDPDGNDSGYGVLVTAGRGTLEQISVNGFGSHGVYLLAGRNYGPGNANNTMLNMVRADQNGGDGIRLEGTDANACILIKPDVVANRGYGINLERSASTKIIAPHADQQYANSPGSYRDNGNTNHWDWPYAEGGSSNPLVIGPNSNYGVVVQGQYAASSIEGEDGKNITNHTFYGVRGYAQNHLNLAGQSSQNGDTFWQLRPDRTSVGSLDLRETTSNTTVFSVESGLENIRFGQNILPVGNGSLDLGRHANRYRRVYADTVDVGGLILRNNSGRLEISTNGTTWRRLALEE